MGGSKSRGMDSAWGACTSPCWCSSSPGVPSSCPAMLSCPPLPAVPLVPPLLQSTPKPHRSAGVWAAVAACSHQGRALPGDAPTSRMSACSMLRCPRPSHSSQPTTAEQPGGRDTLLGRIIFKKGLVALPSRAAGSVCRELKRRGKLFIQRYLAG